jgi:hypothetical protein
MPPALDLTGTWSGHYVQKDRSVGIRAEILQRGASLSGRMWDEITEQVLTLAEFVALAGWPPHSDEKLLDRLRAQVDAPPGTPVHYLTQLPPETVLSGSLSGPRLRLRKRYCGPHFTGFRIGDTLIGERISAHQVEYDGEVDAIGRVISGRWIIETVEGHRVERAEGEFLLRR